MMAPKHTNRPFQVHRVQEYDGRRHQVQAARPVALLLKAAVADYTQAIEEHGAGECVSCLALIELALTRRRSSTLWN